jgi:UDP-glucuronate 4-epimerase
MAKFLVTGAAGFIGSRVTQKLLALGHEVVGWDNFNAYYDPRLKHARIDRIRSELKPEFQKNFKIETVEISNSKQVKSHFEQEHFDRVVHLAAQAGVRHSLSHPQDYIDSNITGFLNVLECCRHSQDRHPTQHLVYASTSSVYGTNQDLPFKTEQATEHPVSLYAATKKANELMAHSYSHLFQLPTTGLRFFTVYGPWGRPDMALFQFTKNILEGRPIQIFNQGHHRRDFTYIDDIAEGVTRVAVNSPPSARTDYDAKLHLTDQSAAPYRIYNIGNSKPVELLHYIDLLEKYLGKKAIREMLPLQAGDIPETQADVTPLERDHGYRPNTPVETGIKNFVEWYLAYFK